MNHNHLPSGKQWDDSLHFDTLQSALNCAKYRREKIWCRISGNVDHLFECYPGGRNIAWPIKMLEMR